MERLNTPYIASITELREPMKVLEAAKGRPVAILKNNKQIATLVPSGDEESHSSPTSASSEEVMEALRLTRSQDEPILEYLRTR